MAQYIVEGGCKLRGKIRISGNKNSIFPCMAAALLTKDEVILENIPNIKDTEIMCQILESVGVYVKREGSILSIKAEELKADLSEQLVTRLRGSVVLVGAILARVGKTAFYHPGGDVIGKRSIATHLEGLKKMGFHIHSDDKLYKISRKMHLENVEIFLDEASVTATESLILASALGKATITLKNCATEPHVQDLCNLLIAMGAKIEGVGQSTLKIEGVSNLKGANFSIGCDYIELGTYAVAAAMTKGEIEFENCSVKRLEPVTHNLEKLGIKFEEKNGLVKTYSTTIFSVPVLKTNIWPGFPTDLMSAVVVLATQAKGVFLLHDWMYESRMFWVDKLISMGATITLADPHRVIVYGPSQLKGRELETPDIRAGMALVLAALVAKGRSVINRAELIDRGYEDVVGKLNSLGACIEKNSLDSF